MADMDRLARFGKFALLVALVALLLIGAPGCVINSGAAESKVNWLYNMDDTLSRAQSENKPIMIDFYADWCGPCRQLDKDTYSDDALSAFLNENFVCLKINVDKNKTLASNYKIVSIPAIVFVSPDGTEIGRWVGFTTPDRFYQDAQAKLSQWSP
jgi:thiol:disulfide interchange protein